MIKLDKECQQLLNKLQHHMGRNLMFFGAIESSLKILLPYIRPVGTQENIGSKDKISAMTLGGLFKKYLSCLEIKSESVLTENSVMQDFIEKELKRILDSRNQLVHTFFTIPGIDTYTKKGLENGLHYLDQQYHEAMDFHKQYTAPLLLIFLGIYIENQYKNNQQPTQEIQLFCEVIEQFLMSGPDIPDIKIYDQDSADIISLFQSAEQALPKKEGMTSLSQAGQFIKTKNPNFNPNQYGRKNLKSILISLELFEVLEIPSKNGNGKTVLYRTKPLSSNCEYYVFPINTSDQSAIINQQISIEKPQ